MHGKTVWKRKDQNALSSIKKLNLKFCFFFSTHTNLHTPGAVAVVRTPEPLDLKTSE